MSMYNHLVSRKIENRREARNEAAARKKRLAQSITSRVIEMDFPSNSPVFISSDSLQIGPFETYLLRHHPSEVAGKLAVGQSVDITYDESSEPPKLVVFSTEING